MTKDEMIFSGVLKSINSEVSAAKHAKRGSAAKVDDAEPETKKGSPVKFQKGASSGGNLSKKDREVMGLASGMSVREEAEKDGTQV